MTVIINTLIIYGPIERYHIYVVIIQDIKQMLQQINVTVSHTLREGNQYADDMTKLEASSDVEFLLHDFLPVGLDDLLRSNAVDTLFIRE